MTSRLPVWMSRWLFCLFLGSLLVSLSLGNPHSALSTPSLNQAVGPQLVQQGVDRYQAGDYRGAVTLWQNALQKFELTHYPGNIAIVRENLARAYQQLGQTEQAIAQWQQVVRLYQDSGDQAQLGRALTEQAQLYSQIGQLRRAIELLCNADLTGDCTPNSALQLAQTIHDPVLQAAALGSLGNAYRLIGEYNAAQKDLEASRAIAVTLKQPAYEISALNSLGILYNTLAQVDDRKAENATQSGEDREAQRFQTQAKHLNQQAVEVLQVSFQLARNQNNALEQLRSRQAVIPVYYRLGLFDQAAAAWQQANQLVQRIPDSRDRVFAAIELAQLLQTNPHAPRLQCLTDQRLIQSEALLQQAVAIARHIQDTRAASFALGALGWVYECRQEWSRALDLTQQASIAAEQSLDAKDSLYRWQWQTGRVLKQLHQAKQAIAAYEQAIATLESIRGDLLTATRDIQFDFRDNIEPIYRELVELRLSQETPIQVGTKSLPQAGKSNNFRSILRTIDGLKLAELQNFFGSDCIVAAAHQDSIDLGAKTAAAVFNTIVLNDHTAVILSLPNGQKQFTWLDVPATQLIEQVNAFRMRLEDARKDYDPQTAQHLYDWLIRPFEADLQAAQVNTLVFVQDGIFRTVPMAALHDGQQFLIQKYAIATTPSLTLTDPKPLQRNNLRVLALGLSQAATVDGIRFQALPNVEQELRRIRDLLPGSKELLNQAFTRDRLKQELSETVYPILHVATHGKFAIEPQDTFIVTGDGKKLTFGQLDRLIRKTSRNTEPLELLALTACETATGDDRSALGLAGVAVQAGARSAIASLWSVSDAATATLAAEFYGQLRNPQLSKAQALQAVQKAFVEGRIKVEGIENATHPYYWSAFTLIGNWL